MNAIGKAVNNRSGFLGEKTQCPPSLLCCTRHSPFGDAVPFKSTVSRYLAYLWIWVQVWIAGTVAHTPWPVSSCLSGWVTCRGLQMMLMPVPGSLEGSWVWCGDFSLHLWSFLSWWLKGILSNSQVKRILPSEGNYSVFGVDFKWRKKQKKE